MTFLGAPFWAVATIDFLEIFGLHKKKENPEDTVRLPAKAWILTVTDLTKEMKAYY